MGTKNKINQRWFDIDSYQSALLAMRAIDKAENQKLLNWLKKKGRKTSLQISVQFSWSQEHVHARLISLGNMLMKDRDEGQMYYNIDYQVLKYTSDFIKSLQ